MRVPLGLRNLWQLHLVLDFVPRSLELLQRHGLQHLNFHELSRETHQYLDLSCGTAIAQIEYVARN